MVKKGSYKEENALLLWHQGGLQTHAEGHHKLCPLCHERADATHLIWKCRWIQSKAGDLDPDWEAAIQEGQEKEFWARGLIPLPAPTHLKGGDSILTYYTWHNEALQGVPAGHKIVISVQSTSKDLRLKHYVVGVLHYDENNGRQGAILATPPGAQNPRRAWFYGLMLLQHFVPGPITVQVHSGKIFEAWHNPSKRKGMQDLAQDLTKDTMQRIKVALVLPSQLQAVNHQKTRERQKDAKLAVQERAKELKPSTLEQQLQQQDGRTEKVYKEAAKRIQLLLEDKSHFFHAKEDTAKDKRSKMRWKKKDFFTHMPEFAKEEGHQWISDKIALRCRKCSKRVTIQTPFAELKKATEEQCTGNLQQPSPDNPKGGKKQTRDEVLKQLLDNERSPGDHEWQVSGHYLRCIQCGVNCPKRCNGTELQKTVEQPCFNGPYEPADWAGHHTHKLWRRGAVLTCSQCQAKARKMDGNFVATAKLLAPCASSTSPTKTLQSFFSKTPSH